MSLTPDAVAELAAQDTSTAWLILVTITSDGGDQEIRITSDAVETLSQGFVFSPFPFEVTLPDDVEGRTPQAQLRVDNTDQQIISILRSLRSPARVTIQIVRSADPDIIEREWRNIEWGASDYDVGTITGTLTVGDLATEEFPYVTFDGRFRGLWP
jgi:uncharacterized protein DUF1833